MKKLGILVGVIGLCAIGWFVVHESSIDYVATVDDELAKLESELANLDTTELSPADVAAARTKIAARLDTINASLDASKERNLTAAQAKMLDDGLVGLERMLTEYQATLLALDQDEGPADNAPSSETIAALTATISSIQDVVGIPDVIDGTATTTPMGETDDRATSTPTLTSQSWTWVQTIYSDGTSITPATSTDQAFIMTFSDDGSLSISTDCNAMGGSYVVDENRLTFSGLFATQMYCVDSYEQAFSAMLDQVQSYFINDEGQVVFNLEFDSGSSIFE